MARGSFAGWFPGLALLLMVVLPVGTPAQEMPLHYCDSLPVIAVDIDGRPMSFLVDTAATSLLNLKSFGEGRTRDVRVTSWTGTLATNAREITIREIVVGKTKLMALKLPAIDLSAIAKACGGKIDGIFGTDLLTKIGATIDFKHRTIHLTTPAEEHDAPLANDIQGDTQRCLNAFNDSDERSFADCLEAEITLFSDHTELIGREPVLQYLVDHYFHQTPPTKLQVHGTVVHPIGESVWYEYEFTVESARGLLRGRGMALCRKSGGHWRIAGMHYTIEHFEPTAECGACEKSR